MKHSPKIIKIKLWPGISLRDIKNLKKAFELLDSEKKGVIKYDLNRIKDIEKFQVIAIEDESVIINFDQFMDIMSYNIQLSRSKYGNDKIVFESETSNVSCMFCPYKKPEPIE